MSENNDSRRPVNEELRTEEDARESEVEREERRLQRLRLVVSHWPAVQPLVREADQWRGSGGTGRFPQLPPEAPDPKEAA
jgi:hypothetical protein